MRHSKFASRRATVDCGAERSATRVRRLARANGAVVVGVVALTMTNNCGSAADTASRP